MRLFAFILCGSLLSGCSNFSSKPSYLDVLDEDPNFRIDLAECEKKIPKEKRDRLSSAALKDILLVSANVVIVGGAAALGAYVAPRGKTQSDKIAQEIKEIVVQCLVTRGYVQDRHENIVGKRPEADRKRLEEEKTRLRRAAERRAQEQEAARRAEEGRQRQEAERREQEQEAARRAEEARQQQEAERRTQKKIAQLKRGAKAGDSWHQANLAWAFYKGLGVPKNYPEAFKWATKSASQGSQYAQHTLGEMYLTGSGVPKDYRKAVEWFRLCASIGDADCEKALGLPALQPTLQALAKIERIAKEKRERREAARRAEEARQRQIAERREAARRAEEARQRQIAARQRLEAAKIAEETRQRLEAERRAAAERQLFPKGTGSGFRISGDGHILTNKHVVTYPNGDKIARCQLVVIHSASGFKKAKILATDGTNDLALLQAEIDGGEALAFSGENASQLDDIVVAGYPFNSYLSSTVKITKGVVNSLAGRLRGSSGNDYSLIQFDAVSQPGNSGGPIINDWGNVVGVTVSGLNKTLVHKETGRIPENTNFGIKSSTARAFLEAHSVDLPPPNSKPMTKREKVELITKTTHLVSCWITRAQARKIKQYGKKQFKVSPTVLRQIEALR